MRVAVTGASGLIGGALVPHLRAQGHDVVRFVRRASGSPDEVTWDPMGGTVDMAALGAVDELQNDLDLLLTAEFLADPLDRLRGVELGIAEQAPQTLERLAAFG